MSTSSTRRLPNDFIFGAATSAFQIEGAASADGKGDSVWDVFCRVPGAIAQADTGEIACDHYHRLDGDLDLLVELGLDAYRFSLSWPRVMADGLTVNPRGLDFYERLVDGVLARGMQPWPTLYHWDLPQSLQDRGGWPYRDTVARFADYAAVVAERLGDRVQRFTTLNEPWCAAFLGHAAGVHAPGMQDPAVAIAAAHHLLLAHAEAAARLRAADPAVEVGITLNLSVIDPLREEDEPAARLIDGQLNRFFLDPLFRGAYPADIREGLDGIWPEGLVQPGDLERIAAPIDFLGVNYYRGEVASYLPADPRDTLTPPTSRPPASPYLLGEGIHFHANLAERTSLGWVVQPEGLTRLLRRIWHEYAEPAGVPLAVTENGAAYDDVVSEGRVDDAARIRYVESHLNALVDAREAGVDVRAYFYWSLFDNFEWDWGYSQRFGIVHVDYDTQARTIKQSGRRYAQLVTELRG